MEMGAFIRSKNVLLAELSEGAFIRRGALIKRNTVLSKVYRKANNIFLLDID
jgi:hypothetical protein